MADTYRLKNATLKIDTGGTPVTLSVAASNVGIEGEQNYASHDRTGGQQPYDEWIDTVYTLELGYTHGFGTDGVFQAFEALKGTEVDWELDTDPDNSPAATAPVITFTATVPAISPLPATDWGEFATGTISVPIKGVPAVAVA